jgi:hypothetical protein
MFHSHRLHSHEWLQVESGEIKLINGCASLDPSFAVVSHELAILIDIRYWFEVLR